MDRRSFMLGLAATTAAVPLAGVVPANGDLLIFRHKNLTATEILARYGRGPAMDVLPALRELAQLRADILAGWANTAEALVPPRLRDWPV